MNHNPVGWFEIYVQDMERAKAFYEGLFGVVLSKIQSEKLEQEKDHIEMWGFPMFPEGCGISGALVRMAGFPSGANSVLVYFRCTDCAVEASKVVQLGGRIQNEKFSISQYGYISHVIDTEGNMIGLHSMQ